MTPEQAATLGTYIRERREALGLSARELARRADIADVIRIEQGQIASPRTDTLKAIADVLDVPLSDLLAIGQYLPEDELPTIAPYLRAKYDLPDEALADIEHYFTYVAKRHGIDPSGPKPGEDEN